MNSHMCSALGGSRMSSVWFVAKNYSNIDQLAIQSSREANSAIQIMPQALVRLVGYLRSSLESGGLWQGIDHPRAIGGPGRIVFVTSMERPGIFGLPIVEPLPQSRQSNLRSNFEVSRWHDNAVVLLMFSRLIKRRGNSGNTGVPMRHALH